VALAGWRQDEYYSLEEQAATDAATGLPELENMLIAAGGGDPETVETLTYSVVAHVPDNWLPGNTGLSLHYGFSENFSLSASSRDFYGNAVPQASGETKEYGFTFKLFDNKLIARVNWFETTLLNAQVTKNLYNIYVNRGIMPVYGHLLEAEFLGNNPEVEGYGVIETPNYDKAMQALAAFRELIPQETIDLSNIQNPDGSGASVDARENVLVGDVEDLKAEGMEVELTYNPTRNWRISLNVAKQETIKNRYAPYLVELMETFDPYLGFDNGSLRNAPFFSGYNADPPTYIHGPDQSVNTIAKELDRLVYAEYRAENSLLGTVSPEQRKWRVNLVTNYTFRDGLFDGFSIGAAYRWQDGVAIGYPVSLDPESGLKITDTANPHIGPAVTNVDTWLRYRRKLFDGKVDWTIEFRVKNLNTDADDLIPVASNQREVYDVAIWRAGSPRIWEITNTFKF
jgi:hypothetical protein